MVKLRLAFTLPLLAPALLAPSVAAQSGIRGWGEQTFDSRWNDGPYLQVACGGDHTTALRTDGTIVSWGETIGHAPTLPPGVNYVEVACSLTHDVARRSDGEVVAWGDDSSGQCDVPPLPPGLTYVEIAAGASSDEIERGFTLARRSDGSVVAWGDRRYGVLDVPPLPRGVTYVEIAAGPSHALARRSDGNVVAWGDNGTGQCDVPPLPPGLSYVEIAGGGHWGMPPPIDYWVHGFSLARRSDGIVVAWGSNDDGQCNVPPTPPGVDYVQVAAGNDFATAVRSDGAVVAWGLNDVGQCVVPALPGTLTYVQVAAGGFWDLEEGHAVALRSDGSVAAWGDNSWSQCNAPALPPGVTYVDVDAFESATIAVRSDGQIVVWGTHWGNEGLLAVPPLPPGLRYVEADVGWMHAIARRSDGSVVTWGSISYVPALPPGVSYVEVDAGGFHCVARRSDGFVVAWGHNNHGQCNVPPLPPGVTYVEVSAGGSSWDETEYTLARRSDGSVVGWGDNTYGQLNIPALPPGLVYVGIAAGAYDHALLRSDGAIVAYGAPGSPPGTYYTKISAGYEQLMALRNTDEAVVWGCSEVQLGQCDEPALDPGLQFVQLAGGWGHSVGRYEGCATCEAPFCLGDGGARSVPCPCGNDGRAGRGCDNSAATGGAALAVHGSVPDRVALSATGVIDGAVTLFLQGRSVLDAPVVFGDGVRCIGGGLVRLAIKTAVGGAASFPETGDPTIRMRSAALGDLIASGSKRDYQVEYLDSNPRFCNPGPARFNASNAVMVAW